MKDILIITIYFTSVVVWLGLTAYLALNESHYIFVGLLGFFLLGSIHIKIK